MPLNEVSYLIVLIIQLSDKTPWTLVEHILFVFSHFSTFFITFSDNKLDHLIVSFIEVQMLFCIPWFVVSELK